MDLDYSRNSGDRRSWSSPSSIFHKGQENNRESLITISFLFLYILRAHENLLISYVCRESKRLQEEKIEKEEN